MIEFYMNRINSDHTTCRLCEAILLFNRDITLSDVSPTYINIILKAFCIKRCIIVNNNTGSAPQPPALPNDIVTVTENIIYFSEKVF